MHREALEKVKHPFKPFFGDKNTQHEKEGDGEMFEDERSHVKKMKEFKPVSTLLLVGTQSLC